MKKRSKPVSRRHQIPTADKPRIKVISGWYIGQIHKTEDGWNVWCPLAQAPLKTPGSLMGCYRLARYYFLAGIGLQISTRICRERGEEMEQLTKDGWIPIKELN